MEAETVKANLEKFCVFCGNKPEGKNKEHILPKWLLRMTGDEKRQIKLFLNKKTVRHEEQSAQSFVFPACEACNSEFSHLEGRASDVIRRLLSENPVKEADLNDLLDWMDKIRVGVWLADIVRNRDFNVVSRNFHIKTRVGQKDRCLFVFKLKEEYEGLNIIGSSTLMFHGWPSAFGLGINQYMFVNVSSDFLFMHRLGFPIWKNREFTEDGRIKGDMETGTERVRLPIVSFSFNIEHRSLFQPCFPTIEPDQGERMGDYLKSEYITGNLLTGNKGRLFDDRGQKMFSEASDSIQIDLSNLTAYSIEFLPTYIGLKILEIQLRLFDQFPDYSKMDIESRRFWRKYYGMAKRMNQELIKAAREELKPFNADGIRKLPKLPWKV
ncbi:hypothetical protein [Methylorubrum aminovorans]